MGSLNIFVDAVSVQNTCINSKIGSLVLQKLDIILDDFTIDEYKSMLFLLMDKIQDIDKFLSLINQDTAFIKKYILDLELEETLLIELFGTLKMYKALKEFGTCAILFKMKKQDFNKINKLWKFLFDLCEEISDDELHYLRIDDAVQYQISSAEEFFAQALKRNIINKDDVSKLKLTFEKNSKCLNIINDYENPELNKYEIKDPSSGSPCGIALILNFETFTKPELTKRDGSAIDVARLKKLWEDFGFETIVENDLSSSEVFETLRNLSFKDHSLYDAFICCVLSHGDSNVIYASDGFKIHLSTLIETICNAECKTLQDKPKLFFIQACQGSNMILNGMTNFNDCVVSEPHIKLKMNPLDVYAVVSTLNGYASFRSPEYGGLFINYLCEVMSKHGHKDSISDVINDVRNEIAKIEVNYRPDGHKVTQIPPAYSTLRKRLILKKVTYL